MEIQNKKDLIKKIFKVLWEATYVIYQMIAVMFIVGAIMFGGINILEDYSEQKLILWIALVLQANLWVDTYKKLRKFDKEAQWEMESYNTNILKRYLMIPMLLLLTITYFSTGLIAGLIYEKIWGLIIIASILICGGVMLLLNIMNREAQ